MTGWFNQEVSRAPPANINKSTGSQATRILVARLGPSFVEAGQALTLRLLARGRCLCINACDGPAIERDTSRESSGPRRLMFHSNTTLAHVHVIFCQPPKCPPRYSSWGKYRESWRVVTLSATFEGNVTKALFGPHPGNSTDSV